MKVSTHGAWIGLALLALSGCTTYLDAERVSSPSAVPPAGAPYYLTFTQYTVVVTRRLVCEPSMGITISAKLTREESRDPDRNYIINLEALQSALKSTDVTVTYYDSGALRSVNATAEDRTGEVLVAVAGTVGKVVLAVTGAPVLMGAKPGDPPRQPSPPQCDPTAKETLAKIMQAEEDLAARTATVKQLEAELAILTAAGQTLGRAWPAPERREHADKMKALFEESRELQKQKGALAKMLAEVSVVTEVGRWPPKGDVFATTASLVPDLDEAKVKEWLLWKGDEKAVRTVIEGSRVYARLCSVSTIGRSVPCNGGAPTPPGKTATTEANREMTFRGLKYRVPVLGRVELCTTSSCAMPDVAYEETLISQLGPIFTLPLRSAVFTNKTVVAEFDQQGRPVKLGVASKAAAEKAASTADGLTEQALAVRGAMVSTKLERIQEETEILKAQQELAVAKAALAPPPATSEQAQAREAFAADTALLEAELANVEARVALEAAKRLAGQP